MVTRRKMFLIFYACDYAGVSIFQVSDIDQRLIRLDGWHITLPHVHDIGRADPPWMGRGDRYTRMIECLQD